MKLFKNKLFIKGLAYDLAGMATVAIPLVGPFLDLVMGALCSEKNELKCILEEKGN